MAGKKKEEKRMRADEGRWRRGRDGGRRIGMEGEEWSEE